MGDPQPPFPERIVAWQGDARGELLWPQDLPEGDVIDLSQVAALGSWAYAWFRAHPGQDVVRPNPELKRQLEAAGLELRWRDPTVRIGLTAAERADLLDPPDPPPTER